MYLNRDISSLVDKENAGTPVRTKIQTQNSAVLQTPGRGTPMRQPLAQNAAVLQTPGRGTPMRQPLAQVNQGVRSTPRLLNKSTLTPCGKGTPKMPSRTPAKKIKKPLPLRTRKSQTERSGNLERIVNTLTNQIIQEELNSVFSDVKTKYCGSTKASISTLTSGESSSTSDGDARMFQESHDKSHDIQVHELMTSMLTQLTEGVDMESNQQCPIGNVSSATDEESSQQCPMGVENVPSDTDEGEINKCYCQLTVGDGVECRELERSNAIATSLHNDIQVNEVMCCLLDQLSVDVKQPDDLAELGTDSTQTGSAEHQIVGLLKQPDELGTDSRQTESADQHKFVSLLKQPDDLKELGTDSRQIESADQHKFVSLLDPLKNWNFTSEVSIVTPVKAAYHGGQVRNSQVSKDEMNSTCDVVQDIMTPEQQRTCLTPVTCHNMSCQMTPVTLNEMSSQMTPAGHREMYSEMTPISHREMPSQMTPITLNEVSSQMTPITLNEVSSQMTPISHREMPSQMTPITLNEVSSQMTPISHREMPSQMTPITLNEVSSQMTPISHREMPSQMTPITLNEVSSQMTPISHREMPSQITPISHTDSSSHMTPVRVIETGTCTATPAALNDGATSMTPIKHSDVSSGTPVKMTDVGICQTPVHQTHVSTETLRVELKDSSVMGTTIDLNDQATVMTPIKHTDAALTCMTPIKMQDGFTVTDTAELVDTGLDPIPIDTSSMSTMTSPVKVAHVEVCTDRASLVDAKVGMTPVRMVETSCAMTPHQMVDNSTCFTPVTVSEMETLTSPIAVPVYRWEADSAGKADPASLIDHLETASISNQLLRREVQMWTQKHAAVSQQLSKARDDLMKKNDLHTEKDQKAQQLENLAKVSLEKDIESLMCQVGEQMMQISELQNTLEQKSIEVQSVQEEKAECQEQYQKEIHNLQEDLKTSYRQHQQQVTELEEEIKRNNYKSHYERAQETIQVQKIQLEAYTQLGDTMQQAAKIQEEFGSLEEGFSNVMTLFQKTLAKKQIWQSENQAMQTQMETNQQQLSEAQDQLQQAVSGKVQAEFDLHEAKQRESASQDLNQALQAQLDTANECVAELKKKLHASKLEALGFQEDFQKFSSQCDALKEANIAAHLKEKSLEAALSAQTNQWKQTETRMAKMKEQYQAQMQELQQQCQGLMNRNSEIETQLSMTQENKSVLKADLTLSRSMVEQQCQQIEAQNHELETFHYQHGQMKSKIKDLEDNSEFLEQERKALEDATTEADDNLRVTRLELSRCKVALEESETARKQWEAAVDDVTERLQELQSELDNTKAYAHWMLLNQATEMSDAAQGLQGIHLEIDTMKQQLKQTLGVDLTKERELSPIKGTSTSSSLNSSTTSSSAPSIVASVLSALQIKGSSTPKENSSLPTPPLFTEDDNFTNYELQDMAMADSIRESLGSGTNIVIGQSSGSAFTALKNTSNGSSASSTPPVQGSQEKRDCKEGRAPSLGDQVGQVGQHFGQVLKGLIIHVSTLQESLQQVQEERDALQKNTTKSRQNYDSDLSLVQEQLRGSEARERTLQQDLANTKAKLCDMEQNLQYAEQRIQGMADNLTRFSDQKYTIEKLKQDVKDHMTARRSSELEKNTLQQLLDDLVSKVNASDDDGQTGSQVYGCIVKENCKLKVESEKLRMKVIERQEHYESLHSRANRQMKVLEGNWKKAEAEIYRLDDIFDKCKQLIHNVPCIEEEDENMEALRQIFT